ncbi:MAG: hypothetical protein GKR89_17835 [Candidatus Latescibacteria bacterium]|nr:hypothetical protein [Candidatus Latescibacterota bacterium]
MGILLWGLVAVSSGADDPLAAKTAVAQKVFADLVRAVGDGRPQPRLQLVPPAERGPMQVAWFDPRSKVLSVEERLYDTCAAMGADSLDALALMIGHELAHYYKDHGWGGDFGNGFADLSAGRAVQSLGADRKRLVEMEAAADYFGAFYGYLAGYKTLDVAPAVLQRVYNVFGLKAQMAGYPDLDERQKIARRSLEKVRDLVPVFEAGGLLALVGLYEEAARCFDYVAYEFPSREMINNAGVARVLDALRFFAAGQVTFVYPLELDMQSRLGAAGKASDQGREDVELRDQLLVEAGDCFERARRADPAYATAYTNLACVRHLQGEDEEALLWAGKAVKLARQQGAEAELAHALVMRGIVRSAADGRQAAADFAAALEASPALVRANLQVLEGAARPGSERPPSRSGIVEQIAGMKARDYRRVLAAPDAIAVLPEGSFEQPSITVYGRWDEGWTGLAVEADYRTAAFVSTGEGYDGASVRGVRLGVGLDKVEAAYGTASGLVAARGGDFHIYAAEGVVFHLEGGAVQGWTLFAVEE